RIQQRCLVCIPALRAPLRLYFVAWRQGEFRIALLGLFFSDEWALGESKRHNFHFLVRLVGDLIKMRSEIAESNLHFSIYNMLFHRVAIVAFEGKLNPRVILFKAS